MKYLFLVLVVSSLILVVSCKKDNENNDDTIVELKFDTLYANPDTIAPAGQTQIHAVATGNDLTYTWTATQGDFIGGSSSVNYLATPCMFGTYDVSCKVTDSRGNQLSRTCNVTIQ